jgi:hypothetical protein
MMAGGLRVARLWAIVGLAALAVSLAACKRLPAPPPVAAECAAVEPTTLPALDAYIDDSESMQGFLRGDSAYRRVISALFEKTITAGYARSVFPLSMATEAAKEKAAGSTTITHLLSADFYHGKETPLATLLERIGKSPADRITIIVSDLVQSEAAKSGYEFIKAFRGVADVRPEILLLAFRSSFQGKYYVETRPTDWNAYELTFDGKTLKTSRGFYILVFAPAAALGQFRRYVLDHLAPDAVFHASQPPIGMMSVNLDGGAYGLYEPIDTRPVQRGCFTGTFVERAAGKDAKPHVRLKIAGERRLPLHSSESFPAQVLRPGTKAGEWSPPEAATVRLDGGMPPLGPGEFHAPGKLDGVLSFQLPRPRPYQWDVYRVRVQAGRTNVGVPGWVTGWTTRDDRPLATGHQTLNLHLLVEAMIRAITEQVAWSDHVVRLGREN